MSAHPGPSFLLRTLFFLPYSALLGRPYRPAVRTPPFHGGNTGSNPVRVAKRATPSKPASAEDPQPVTGGLHRIKATAVLVAFCHFLRSSWPTWPVLPYLGYLFEQRNLPREISFWGSGVTGGLNLAGRASEIDNTIKNTNALGRTAICSRHRCTPRKEPGQVKDQGPRRSFSSSECLIYAQIDVYLETLCMFRSGVIVLPFDYLRR